MKEQNIDIKVDGESAPIFLDSGNIAVRESLDFFLPYGSIIFNDRLSAFVSYYPFLQDTELSISIDDGEVSKKWDFLAFSSSKTRGVSKEDYNFTLHLISKYSKDFFLKREYHSKICSISDYIKYIADKAGLEADVEPTKGTLSIINPNWKYPQIVRWLAQRAISTSGSGGYQYYIDYEGKLVFKSIDKLFDEDAIDVEVGSYTVGSDEEEEPYINKELSIKDNHFSNVLLGSNNIELSAYDYKTGALIKDLITYEKYLKKKGNVKGIAVSYSSEKGEAYSGSGFFKDKDDALMAGYKNLYNMVVRQLESVQLSIVLPINNKIKLGSIINLTVPANPDLYDGGVNLNYSGKYMVKTLVTMGHTDFMQRLILVKPGLMLESTRKTGYY